MKKIKLILAIVVAFTFIACGNKDAKNTDKDLEVGGLYASQNKDGSYSVTKIIALDEVAVHIKMYSNKFEAIPEDIDAEKLQTFIGHAPMAREGFLLDSPKLLKVEKVTESELEGYNYYKQQ